jgi:hypothetical protein
MTARVDATNKEKHMTDQVKPIGDEKPATEVKTPEVVTIGSKPAVTPEVVVAPAKAL